MANKRIKTAGAKHTATKRKATKKSAKKMASKNTPRKSATKVKINDRTKKERGRKQGKFIKGVSVQDVEKEIQKLSGWEPNKSHTQISKIYEFPSFISALAFIAKITVHAEVLQHHPDIELSYGKVKVKLTTHHTKCLTKLDFALAERIDGIVVRV